MKDPRPRRSKAKSKKNSSKPKADAVPMEEATKPRTPAVWRPGEDPIEEGETLDYDPTAYDCLHCLTLDYPCLSFDIIKDDMGGPRSNFPHSLYFVAATQADTPRNNYLAFVRLTNLQQGKHGKKQMEDSEDEDMSDSDEEEGGPAIMHARLLGLSCGANRVRCMPQRPSTTAVWQDSGHVKIFDAMEQMQDLAAASSENAKRCRVPKPCPVQSHKHSSEGFAVDWSRAAAGKLASGDNHSRIHIWEPTSSSGAAWAVSSIYKGHTASVEDLQWSPVEETVFASCSADKTVRIWDTRTRSKSMLSTKAHESDVNVISWNAETNYMLASGGDDGELKVWDLRSFVQGAPVANFTHHKAAITSVEWCPMEASMLATTSADNQLCVWDLALERDPEEEVQLADGTNAEAADDLPPQLLFIHGGQNDLKEVLHAPKAAIV